MDIENSEDEDLIVLARDVVEDNRFYRHYWTQCPGPSQLHFLTLLGEGSYSSVSMVIFLFISQMQVYLVRDTVQGRDAIPRYACKVIDKMHVVKNDMVLQILRERRVMEFLNFRGGGHPFIPKLYCHFQDDKYMCKRLNILSHWVLFQTL